MRLTRLHVSLRLTIVALALLLCATLLPTDAATAAPETGTTVSPSSANNALLLDGSSSLPDFSSYDGVTTTVTVARSVEPRDPGAPVEPGSAVRVVAQPASFSAAPAVLDDRVQTQTVALGDNPCASVFSESCAQVAVGALTCLNPITAIATLFIFQDWGCLHAVVTVAFAVAAWVLEEVFKAFIYMMNYFIRNAVVVMTKYVIVGMLGSNNGFGIDFTPIISCDPAFVSQTTSGGATTAAAETCAPYAEGGENNDNYWFQGQYDLMRTIGFFLIIPLLMLVAMQSLIRGSLFFLLRAFLIMLPVAVIGGVLMTGFAQVLMNVADDMAIYIASQTVDPAEFGDKLAQAVGALDEESFGIFTIVWFIAMLISMIIILLELIIREMGIYLTMIFVPIAFATMVYPPTVKWLKRAVTLLLGLIFMKLFLVAAMSMGFAAMASSVTDADTANQDVVVNMVIIASIVFLMAGFGGAKILAFSPVSEAVSQKIFNPAETLGMGDYAAQRLDKWTGKVKGKAATVAGGGTIGGGVGADDMAGGGAPGGGDGGSGNGGGGNGGGGGGPQPGPASGGGPGGGGPGSGGSRPAALGAGSGSGGSGPPPAPAPAAPSSGTQQ